MLVGDGFEKISVVVRDAREDDTGYPVRLVVKRRNDGLGEVQFAPILEQRIRRPDDASLLQVDPIRRERQHTGRVFKPEFTGRHELVAVRGVAEDEGYFELEGFDDGLQVRL